jgi:probable HAF family extracellular repeat protein
MYAARYTIQGAILLVVLGTYAGSAKAGPIYTVRDLGIVSFADLDDSENRRVYVTNSGQIGHGTAPSQGVYVVGVNNSHADSTGPTGYVTANGGPEIPITPPNGSGIGTIVPLQVNGSGEVVGFGLNGTADKAVFYQVGWPQNATAEFLPQLPQLYSPGHTASQINSGISVNYSVAIGINSQGQIVGSTGNSALDHAFIFSNGTITDLNALIPQDSSLVLNSAVSINDLGEITGYATDSTGNIHEYLLTPSAVPEPSTFISMMVGLGIFFVRHKSKNIHS